MTKTTWKDPYQMLPKVQDESYYQAEIHRMILEMTSFEIKMNAIIIATVIVTILMLAFSGI